MITLSASQARAHFFRLMDEVALSHQPVLISGKRNRRVLVAEED